MLLYVPTQIPFSSGEERVTCRGLKLTNYLGLIIITKSLGKQKLELWTRKWNLWATFRLANDFFPVLLIFFFLFLSWEISSETLMTFPEGNRKFCFPSTSIFLSANWGSPWRPVIKCLLSAYCQFQRVIKLLECSSPVSALSAMASA